MLKKTQVVMLPTNDKKAPIAKSEIQNWLYLSNSKSVNHFHLYFLSDEEIKDGDWFYVDPEFGKVEKAKYFEKNLVNGFIKSECKKVIATTDSSLMIWEERKDNNYAGFINLAQPSNGFIEKYISEYNKENVIEWVNIEYDHYDIFGNIIDELFHGETDQWKLKVNSKNNTITIKGVKDSWNKDEIIQLFKDLQYDMAQSIINNTEKIIPLEWIRENI